MMKQKNLFRLILSIIFCLSAGYVGSFAVTQSIDTWYANLVKPQFTPPDSFFGPIWTILYILMGIALYLVWIEDKKRKKVTSALKIFSAQLLLNILWSIIFFGLHSPIGALIEIVSLWLAILLTITRFSRISSAAAWLLIPYLVWVTYAAILNAAIAFMNI